MIRIGIPQALLYYQYYPAIRTFFEELGAEIITSPPTSRETLASGSSRVVADTCLPVKIFLGHVLALVGQCDYMFIPVIRSIKPRVYNCSKFLGLPDMTRAVIPESPPILEIEIDVNKGKHKLYQEVYRLGHHFSLNPLKIKRAARTALKAHLDYLELMRSHQLTPPQAIASTSGVRAAESEDASPRPEAELTIALIGHPYLLYDEYINHRLIQRLARLGAKVATPEVLTPRELESALRRLVGGAYWTYEAEVVGAGEHYLTAGVDGVIGLMAFGCGPDSVMMDMVAKRASSLKATPFMSLVLEEHQSSAGILTRLEAFLDMIERRKQKKAKICV